MRRYRFFVTFIIVLTLKHNVAKQHYNQNTDFLLHEAGLPASNPSIPKRDYVAPQPTPTMKRTEWPALGPTSSSLPSSSLSSPQPAWTTKSTGKRDYVAPNRPSVSPQTTKSDFPVLGPSFTSQTTARPLTSLQPSRPTQSSGRRDYVAPNYPTLKPPVNAQQGTGKVKDLVNFYDGKDKQQNTPQPIPSYSSILQATTAKPAANGTPKPLSFSAVVAGSNRPTSGLTFTTAKSTTTGAFGTPKKPVNNVNRVSTARPVVLPSSLANGNQGSNGNAPTDTEIQTLSEELLKRDVNNAAKYITINYQEKTTSHSTEDKAPLPLLSVTSEAWNIPTIQKFTPLLDNYERDTLVNEYVTPQERNEENAFLDAIMSTTVIRHLMNFFKDKGYVTADPRQQRDFLKQMWFGLYSRGKGKLSSSGFEHVFVSELKDNKVLGLHNWIYFAREEQANRINYLGYLKYADLGDKGAVVKFHVNQQGVDKPVDAIFVGTSPELEIALYTLCFVTRVDNDCSIKLAGKDVNIAAYNFRYRSKNYIGSAFPQI